MPRVETMSGWVLLLALTLLALLGAMALARRTEPAGRAELAVIAFLGFCALVGAPVLVLGYLQALTPRHLAFASALPSLMVLVAATRGRAFRQLATDARALARLPQEALLTAWRARSVSFVLLLATAGIVTAALVLTVLVPNATWDGFLYHEPIVGFALQHHGFRILELPSDPSTQAINSYPKLGEALSLWFVAFTDKTLVELPNTMAAPVLVLATYLLVRRFGSRVDAMGWACLTLLMPQTWAQLCQTYLDILVGVFAIAMVHFATRPGLRARDVWLMTLAGALWLETKSSALVAAPLLAALGWVRWIAKERARSPSHFRAALGTVTLSALVLAAAGAFVPLRNWRALHNPFYPVAFDAFGRHFPGLLSLRDLVAAESPGRAFAIAYDAPSGGLGDIIDRGYGYALVWMVAPAAVVGCLLGGGRALAELFRLRERTEATNLGLVLVALAVSVGTSPTLGGHNARYNLHVVACALAVAAWVLAQPRFQTVRPMVMAGATVLALVPLTWNKGTGWYWVSTRHYEDVLRHPLEARVVLPQPEFDVIAWAREHEVYRGDLVVFDQQVTFLGALWNFEMSNRVEYVPYGNVNTFLRTIAERRPTWVVLGEADDARRVLESTGRWEYVGPLTPNISAVYRARLDVRP